MAEAEIIVDGKKLEYEGLFQPGELYTVIDELMAQRTFDKNEYRNFEYVHEGHKQIDMELRPYKKLSDYIKVEIRIKIRATNLKHVEIEKNGVKKKYYHGKVKVVFVTYLITDYENAWETKAFYFLARMLVDKFIYKGYLSEAKAIGVSVTNEAYYEIRSYLNMHRYKT